MGERQDHQAEKAADHCIPPEELDKIAHWDSTDLSGHHLDCPCKVCFEAKVRLRMAELTESRV